MFGMLLMFMKRLLGKSTEQRQHDTDSVGALESKIIAIQNGDTTLRNELIAQYQPYVIKVVNKVCKRFIDRYRDDEYSIALLAFNEAIDSYQVHCHPSFLAFSETVMRRRLIDYFRKEAKYHLQIPMSGFDMNNEEDETYNPIEIQMAVEDHQNLQINEERRWEIERYTELLEQYGMTMQDLVDASPKHADTRVTLIEVSRIIVENEALAAQVKNQKTLPLKELTPLVHVSRKTLERNRKYIIAISLIRMHPFTYLREYLKIPDEKGGEK